MYSHKEIYIAGIQSILACVHECRVSTEAILRACFLAVSSMQVRTDLFWKDLNKAYTWYSDHSRKPHDRPEGFNSMLLYPNKAQTIDALRAYTSEIRACVRAHNYTRLHDMLCTINGLGPVKAGFIVQLCTGEIGCIDTINMQTYGVDKRALTNLSRRKDAPKQYRQFVKQINSDPVDLWASWCEAAGLKYNMDPINLSYMHADFVCFGHTD